MITTQEIALSNKAEMVPLNQKGQVCEHIDKINDVLEHCNLNFDEIANELHPLELN